MSVGGMFRGKNLGTRFGVCRDVRSGNVWPGYHRRFQCGQCNIAMHGVHSKSRSCRCYTSSANRGSRSSTSIATRSPTSSTRTPRCRTPCDMRLCFTRVRFGNGADCRDLGDCRCSRNCNAIEAAVFNHLVREFELIQGIESASPGLCVGEIGAEI